MANDNALARIDTNSTPSLARPIDGRAAVQARNLDDLMRVSQMVARSGLYGVRSVEDAFVRMLQGVEMGLGMAQSLRGIANINGKPVTEASTMVAVCLARPDICEYFTCTETTAKSATYEAKRKGAPRPVSLTYTIEQANTAKLTGKDVWRAHPEDMLRARASSKLARMVFPDLVGGIYTPDEADDFRRPAQSAPEPVQVESRVFVPEPSESPAAGLAARLEAAQDARELAEVAADIKRATLGFDEVEQLRVLYLERAKALRGEVAREPGEEG